MPSSQIMKPIWHFFVKCIVFAVISIKRNNNEQNSKINA